jgi:hypothetical protein
MFDISKSVPMLYASPETIDVQRLNSFTSPIIKLKENTREREREMMLMMWLLLLIPGLP